MLPTNNHNSPLTFISKSITILKLAKRCFLIFLILVTSNMSPVQAFVQASPCTPLDPQIKGWPSRTTVFYDISGLPEPAQSQARDAFNVWNTANSNSNGSGVVFRPSDAVHPPNFAVINASAGGFPASTDIARNPTTGRTTGAAAKIDINNSGIYASGQPGFDTVFKKVMLHEIGHTMGITDQP
ncbi:MAG: hypothetical protein ACRD4L_13770, partial [Pyrinomonadaceae bacterium]